jgi:formyltetrahydrofolate deformylase
VGEERPPALQGTGVQVTRLLISCADQPGLVAAVAGFLRDAGANIIRSDQHSSDPADGTFYMRMEFSLPIAKQQRAKFEQRFHRYVGRAFGMEWRMSDAAEYKRVAVLVSREDHCLVDLLWRSRRGELEANVTLVASNHLELRRDVEAFGIPYHHIPVTRDGKAEAEARLLKILMGGADIVVLARYMQILSGAFLDRLALPVINIHHSFLPAFPGSRPYQRAKERGVKLIGATAHYVTEELDAGPIIEQDVIRVTHREDAAALARLGRDIERTVLARAVTWHCQDRVLVHDKSTVVF